MIDVEVVVMQVVHAEVWVSRHVSAFEDRSKRVLKMILKQVLVDLAVQVTNHNAMHIVRATAFEVVIAMQRLFGFDVIVIRLLFCLFVS
jgi:hypothetical protein